jgi:hypothetical protein
MKLNRSIMVRAVVLISLIASLTLLSTRLQADTGNCGGATTTLPFTDVQGNPFFCLIAEAYFSGLTAGTSATTYSPTQNVTREQMAAFTTRTLDQSLKRGNRRASAQQWWQPKTVEALRSTSLDGRTPLGIAWDGADLWVSGSPGRVLRVRASDGKVLETWTGASGASAILVAAGRVFITGVTDISFPGQLFVIDPAQPPGAVTILVSNIPPAPVAITFDGQFLWTANSEGSITRIPLTGGGATTFTSGFTNPSDILWDGENLWVADLGANMVKRVDPSSGAVLESILAGSTPLELLFDGANLWVSNHLSDGITVIRAMGSLRGTVLATLTGNGLDAPRTLAFDGERVLVVNQAGHSVSLFKAADFSPLGTVSVGDNTFPFTACSDGLNFWITRPSNHDIMRF